MPNPRILVALVTVVLAATLAAASSVVAAPGDVDPTYGLGGTALVAADVSSTLTIAMAAHPDGRAVMLGNINHDNPDADEYELARFTANGLLDSSFSGDGVFINYMTVTAEAKAIGLHPNGDIALAGRASNAVMGARVSSNGVGSIMGTSTAPGTDCFLNGLAFFADKITAAGNCGIGAGSTHLIGRYASTPVNADAGFGSGGFTSAGGGGGGEFEAIAALPDGRTVAAGFRFTAGAEDIAAVCYTTGGTFCSSFTDGVSGAGRVKVPVGDMNDRANAIAVAPDGKIVLAGSAQLTGFGSSKFGAIVQLNSDGSLDTTFGSGGKLIVRIGSEDSEFNGVAVQPNGNIVAVGSLLKPGVPDPLIMRLTSSGAPDETFAPGGTRIGIPGTSGGEAHDVAILADGKILVGERLEIGAQSYLATTRLVGGEVPGASAPRKPTAKIKSPSKSKLKAKKFKRLSGSSTEASSVQVAILKTDKTLLRKKKRCLQMKNAKAALKKVKAVKGKCQPSVWLSAKGTASWSYKLTKTLKAGKYTLYVRARGAGGTSDNAKKSLTLTK